jgi:hypothetical protein
MFGPPPAAGVAVDQLVHVRAGQTHGPEPARCDRAEIKRRSAPKEPRNFPIGVRTMRRSPPFHVVAFSGGPAAGQAPLKVGFSLLGEGLEALAHVGGVAESRPK